MLQTVTIKNFRSLRDVTLNLQKVNLLIGPNNSGKTNFLKALAFLKQHYAGRIQPSLVDFRRIFFKQQYNQQVMEPLNSMVWGFRWAPKPEDRNSYFYQLELLGYNKNNLLSYIEGAGFMWGLGSYEWALINDFIKLRREKFYGSFLYENNSFYLSESLQKEEIITKKKSDLENSLLITINEEDVSFSNYRQATGSSLKDNDIEHVMDFSITKLFNSIKIFRPDPSKITKENDLFTGVHLDEDCSNLVSFLDNMRDGHDDVWQAIQKDLKKCIPDFEGISFEKVQVNGKESLGKRFGLRDREGKVYWAEELSEGTIYFLALLAIVHQPDPPKVLLLEEPEKGIHPRRIAEVMDLIFRLAEDKDIQIIMTSHSTQVVDAFQDIPESVFVFDMVDGETKVKNLLTDILEPDTKDAEAKKFPPIDYSKRSLSEHWATGLLGGVPH